MSGVPMSPIAVYEAKQPLANHRFELYADVIRVSGSTERDEIDTTIPLVQFDPLLARFWIYSSYFYIGFWTFLLGILALLAVVMVTMLRESGSFPGRPMALAGIPAAAGLALVLANRRKVEHAYFRSDAGVPILTIPRAVKGNGDFDEFIPLLVKQIRLARGEAPPSGSTMPYGAIDA